MLTFFFLHLINVISFLLMAVSLVISAADIFPLTRDCIGNVSVTIIYHNLYPNDSVVHIQVKTF